MPMQEHTIRHTVAFALKHEPGSPAAQKFLRDGQRILTAIPGVRNFECLRQVSRKNSFQYGFSMEFKDQFRKWLQAGACRLRRERIEIQERLQYP